MADLTTLANLKAWLNIGQVTENAAIPAAPGPYVITVAKAAAWNGDGGVVFAVTGAPLAPVAPPPGAGQYAVAAGVYTFNTADKGKALVITYSTVTAEDPLLTRLIAGVSAFIQGDRGIGYQAASQSYALVWDGHGGDVLALGGKPPLTAVASVTVDGVLIPPATTFATPGFRFSPSSIWLQGYAFSRGRGNVEIACTRGWATTPGDLEQACIELCALRYKDRERIGQVSKSLGDGQTVSFSQKEMPDWVKAALQSYKKVVPV